MSAFVMTGSGVVPEGWRWLYVGGVDDMGRGEDSTEYSIYHLREYSGEDLFDSKRYLLYTNTNRMPMLAASLPTRSSSPTFRTAHAILMPDPQGIHIASKTYREEFSLIAGISGYVQQYL